MAGGAAVRGGEAGEVEQEVEQEGAGAQEQVEEEARHLCLAEVEVVCDSQPPGSDSVTV